MMRRRALITLAFVAACSSTTAPAGSSARVEGSWNYVSTNSSAAVATNGVLTVTPRNGSGFGGSFDGTTSEPGGNRRVVGVLSGRMLDSVVVDFDLSMDGSALRHVGSVRGDSLVGNWVETSSVGVVASGTFRARRLGQ
jgi:hypothetical protein